ncbi:MAG: anthranilate synthase component I family protein [Candidatus Eisenbacteria bacterium]
MSPLKHSLEEIDLPCSPAELAAEWGDAPGFALLDSADGRGWSIATIAPREELRADAHAGAVVPPVHCGSSSPPRPEVPPFASGWIGFLAYEAAARFDPKFRVHTLPSSRPASLWRRYDASLAFDHDRGRWLLSARDDASGREAARELRERAHRLTRSLDRDSLRAARQRLGNPAIEESDLSPGAHRVATEAILEWIARGHIYQANLTYRVARALAVRPSHLYGLLRAANPAPYGALLAIDRRLAILSSSPELFLRVRGDEVMTRPIKGTRPRRLDDPRLDRALADELRVSAKDQAELTMIVDLERNDLGRVARYGSVTVEPYPELESFAAVHHLVATVRARLRPSLSWHELLAATFPGGSVTGAPKLRAMEILADLERSPRFVYTGALGWIDDRGDGELNLAIRTLWLDDGVAHFGVGGGIVADSTPEGEWRETEDKARALRRALDQAAALAQHDRAGVDHSYRSASIGSSFEAFRAGQ